MKKIFTPILLGIFMMLSIPQKLAAQSPASIEKYKFKHDSLLMNYGKAGTFVLKGKVNNFKESYIDLDISGYFKDQTVSIMVKSDGSFEQTYPVNGAQQIYLFLNDLGMYFSIAPNDTLEINWDEKNFRNTFAIGSKNLYRDAVLKTQLALILKTADDYVNLLNFELNQKKNPTTAVQKYTSINTVYNKAVAIILKEEKKYPDLVKRMRIPFADLLADQYFIYSKVLLDQKLLVKTPLKITDKSIITSLQDSLINQGRTYRYLRYSILDTVNLAYKVASEPYLSLPSYRHFIYNYLRFGNTEAFSSNVTYFHNPQQLGVQNTTLTYYTRGKLNFSSTLLKDWFITRCINDGFGFYAFKDVKQVYDLYIEECKTANFKEALIQNYEAIKNLKPDLPAPDFSLKDLNGKSISLSQLKGKIVYIDFWGVNCGPCIYDIDNFVPQLHAAYKEKDVIFLNICVDVDEKTWKKGVAQHKLKGINVLAEGWTKNPVCKAYNIAGVPHYLIINKDGTIANNNAPRAQQLVEKMGQNELDNALKRSLPPEKAIK